MQSISGGRFEGHPPLKIENKKGVDHFNQELRRIIGWIALGWMRKENDVLRIAKENSELRKALLRKENSDLRMEISQLKGQFQGLLPE